VLSRSLANAVSRGEGDMDVGGIFADVAGCIRVVDLGIADGIALNCVRMRVVLTTVSLPLAIDECRGLSVRRDCRSGDARGGAALLNFSESLVMLCWLVPSGDFGARE
jgi:hypothetical protein